jgi:hypothetical protein
MIFTCFYLLFAFLFAETIAFLVIAAAPELAVHFAIFVCIFAALCFVGFQVVTWEASKEYFVFAENKEIVPLAIRQVIIINVEIIKKRVQEDTPYVGNWKQPLWYF